MINGFPLLGFFVSEQDHIDDLLRGRRAFGAQDVSAGWLGRGVYFWINGLEHAREQSAQDQVAGRLTHADVLAALIEPANCLDLTDFGHHADVDAGFRDLAKLAQAARAPLPRNLGGGHQGSGQHLDCAVLEHLHQMRSLFGFAPYDTVLGARDDGAPAFPGSAIHQNARVQLAVRDTNAIISLYPV